MSEKYLSAILRWRQYAGPVDTWNTAAVSTILFGCQRWIEIEGSTADQATREQVLAIQSELEAWTGEWNRDGPKPAS